MSTFSPVSLTVRVPTSSRHPHPVEMRQIVQPPQHAPVAVRAYRRDRCVERIERKVAAQSEDLRDVRLDHAAMARDRHFLPRIILDDLTDRPRYPIAKVPAPLGARQV